VAPIAWRDHGFSSIVCPYDGQAGSLRMIDTKP
jgi:hypothetical protein